MDSNADTLIGAHLFFGRPTRGISYFDDFDFWYNFHRSRFDFHKFFGVLRLNRVKLLEDLSDDRKLNIVRNLGLNNGYSFSSKLLDFYVSTQPKLFYDVFKKVN